jgi:hypothetical protein
VKLGSTTEVTADGPDRHVEPRESPPFGGGRPQPAKGAYVAKLAALASSVRDMAPDVLAVQEAGQPSPVIARANAIGAATQPMILVSRRRSSV